MTDIIPIFNPVYYCHHQNIDTDEKTLFCNTFSINYHYYCDLHNHGKTSDNITNELELHRLFFRNNLMKFLNECKITGIFQQKIILMKQLFEFICSNKWFCGMEKKFWNTAINKLIEIIDGLYDNPIHVHEIEIFNTFRQQLTINNTKDILNDSYNNLKVQLNIYYVSWSMCSKNMLPIWHNFIEDLKVNHNVYNIDINEYNENGTEINDHNIREFPMIRLIIGNFTTEFNGEITLNNLYKLLKDNKVVLNSIKENDYIKDDDHINNNKSQQQDIYIDI